MSLAVGALVGADFHKPELWERFGAPVVFVHAHKGQYTGKIGQPVPTVRTTWGQTIAAHYELMRAFVADGTRTHLAIVSESCIPLVTYSEAVARLCVPGMSLLDIVPDTRNRARTIYGRAAQHRIKHEQWACIHVNHAEIMLKYERDVRAWFRDCQADNEHYLGTCLRAFGHGQRIHNQRVTWTRWPAKHGAAHPDTYNIVTADDVTRAGKCVFFRKITPTTEIMAELDLQPETPKRKPGRPAKAKPESKPELRVLYACLTAGHHAMIPALESAIPGLTVFDAGATAYAPASEHTTVVPIENKWVTGNHRQILEYAKVNGYEWTWFLDDDMELSPNALPQMLNAIETLPNVGAIAPVFNSSHYWLHNKDGKTNPFAVPFCELGASMWKVSEIADLPLDFEPGWGYDIHWALTLKKAGLISYCLPSVTGKHLGGTSIDWSQKQKAAGDALVKGLRRLHGRNWNTVIEAGTSFKIAPWMYA